MFIYSLKASTLKLVGVTLASIITLIALIMFIPTGGPSGNNLNIGGTVTASGAKTNVEYIKIKSADDMEKFINNLGWTVGKNPKEIIDVSIPEEFNNVYLKYNDIQKQQGLNLEKYKGKMAKRYTYEITNYPDTSDTVYLNIIIYKNKIVAGDVCSADVTGFIHGFLLDRI